MGFLFYDGFGKYGSATYSPSAGASQFRGAYASIGSWNSNWTQPQIVTVGDGEKWMRSSPPNVGDTNNAWNFETPAWTGTDTVVIGLHVRRESNQNAGIDLVEFKDGSTVLASVRLSSAGTIQVYRGDFADLLLSGTQSLNKSTLYYVEIKIVFHDSTGSVVIHIDEVERGAVSSVDTTAGSTSCDRAVLWTSMRPGWSMRNLYMHDSAMQGIVRIATLPPVADGARNEMTPSTGMDHYALVDEIGPDDDDYLSSGTVGHREQFDHENLTTVGEVLAVQVHARALKDSGTVQLKLAAVRLTDEALSAGKDLGIDPGYVSEIFETAPDTAAWATAARVNESEFGCEVA